MYTSGREAFGRGEIIWKASGGSTIRAFLIDQANYTFSQSHDFLDDVPTNARAGNSSSSTRGNGPQLTLIDCAAGVCDASDLTFTSVTSGVTYEGLLLYKDDGSADSTSRLLAYYDTATGLTLTSNGANITVEWDNGANKVLTI